MTEQKRAPVTDAEAAEVRWACSDQGKAAFAAAWGELHAMGLHQHVDATQLSVTRVLSPDAVAAHIARYDPERALREVEAGRRVLAPATGTALPGYRPARTCVTCWPAGPAGPATTKGGGLMGLAMATDPDGHPYTSPEWDR